MIKYFLALAIMVLLTSAFILESRSKNGPNTTAFSLTDSTEIPEEIISPSTVGEVIFPHLFHYEDLEVECKECHHEINAAELNIPHEDYFKDFWIDCNICHNGGDTSKMEAHDCSDCHHTQLTNIADETLSAKVVIHQNCWSCHEVGKGQEASENCEFCHSGDKIKYE